MIWAAYAGWTRRPVNISVTVMLHMIILDGDLRFLMWIWRSILLRMIVGREAIEFMIIVIIENVNWTWYSLAVMFCFATESSPRRMLSDIAGLWKEAQDQTVKNTDSSFECNLSQYRGPQKAVEIRDLGFFQISVFSQYAKYTLIWIYRCVQTSSHLQLVRFWITSYIAKKFKLSPKHDCLLSALRPKSTSWIKITSTIMASKSWYTNNKMRLFLWRNKCINCRLF